MRRGLPMRALSMTVTALATVAATLGSPGQTLRAARFRGPGQSAATAAVAATELRVGQTYARELSGGVSHRYQLRLDAGEYAGLTVEQRGIDVAVQLLGPDGSTIADFQDELRIGHAEPVEVVAEKAATYTLLVKPGVATAPPGSYAIRIVQTRTASDEDHTIQEARALRVRYAQLFEQGKYEQAKPPIERALTISERVRGDGDPFVGGLLRAFGSLSSDLEEFPTAERLYQRALAAAETTLGPQHPATALAAKGLAWVYEHTGRRPKAEELANRALETALEASNLNLWGTRLVTLSACDTGVGEVRTGEGVYGLRRAFFLAGAETLVMSLWPVSDVVTREMMTAYYGGLKAGEGRGNALRQVQLAMLTRNNRRHPFYWASFIQAGEWTSLDGRR